MADIQGKVNRALQRICGRIGLLPSSLTIPEARILQKSDYPVSCGGFADVYAGRLEDVGPVAIKSIRVYGFDDDRLHRTRRVSGTDIFFPNYSSKSNDILSLSTEILQRSFDLEGSSTSTCPRIHRHRRGQLSIHLDPGLAMDGERDGATLPRRIRA